nr:GLPGLI family protein [Elizabethkingia sp. ASV34]
MTFFLKFFLVSIFLLQSSFFAQKRISYDLQILYSDSLKKNFTMNLDINNDKVYFYDAEFVDPRYSKYKTSETGQFVTRNNGGHENIMFVQDFHSNYYKIKTNDIIKWNLTSDYKTVDKYKLQKATASFGGRIWNVWFCNDIPLMEGPYKFNGLPGLVFEVSENTNVFKYTLIKIENLTKKLTSLEFNDTSLVFITWDKYSKIMNDFYENPYLEERSILQQGGEFTSDDRKVTLQELSQMTKEFQNRIRKHVPPMVEMDKTLFRGKNN